MDINLNLNINLGNGLVLILIAALVGIILYFDRDNIVIRGTQTEAVSSLAQMTDRPMTSALSQQLLDRGQAPEAFLRTVTFTLEDGRRQDFDDSISESIAQFWADRYGNVPCEQVPDRRSFPYLSVITDDASTCPPLGSSSMVSSTSDSVFVRLGRAYTM